jgi:biotin carboxylase
MIIGAGPAQSPGLEAAKRKGFRVYATDGNPDAPGFAHADHAETIDVTDVAATVAFAQAHHPQGVTSFASDITLPTVAAVARALGLPGPSQEMVERSTNKERMRSLCQQAGLATPFFRLCQSSTDAERAAAQSGFPVIVKPVDSAGSRGVSYVDRIDDVAPAFQRAVTFSQTAAVLVEEFIEGPEVSVEGFVVDGLVTVLCLSEKERTPRPYLLDREVCFPSRLNESIEESVRLLAHEVIAALELDNCPFHMEQLLSPQGPRLVEVASRGPGFKVFSHILPHVTGVDVVGAQIELATGTKPNVTPRRPLRGAAIHFLEAQRRGKVVAIKGLDRARQVEGVTEVELYVRLGSPVEPLTSGADRIGHIISLAKDRATAEESLHLARDEVTVEVA